jgi:HlyD family secretion protein
MPQHGFDASTRVLEPPLPGRQDRPAARPPEPSGHVVPADAFGGSRTATVLRRRRRHSLLLAAGIALILAVAAAATVWRLQLAPPIHYTTTTAAIGSVVKTVTASGAVNPVDTIQVGTYVSGVIQQVLCDYNTRVKKGQLCARIDPRPYQMSVDQARANLSAAKAQLDKDQTALDYARLTYNRNVELSGRGIVTQDAVDSAKSTFEGAQAQVALDKTTIEQRTAALNAAEINLGYTDIVSPVDGTVIVRNVTQGQTVAASFQTPTLFVIATDLTKMQVDANVAEGDIGKVHTGATASFTVEAFPDHRFEGTVTAVRQAPQSVQNVVTYDAVISVPNPDLLLKPGMTATCAIVADRRDGVVTVPDQALRFTPGGVTGARAGGTPAGRTRETGPGVWTLRDGEPARIPVTTGLDDDVHVEIVSGLKAGEPVIVGEEGGGAASSRAGQAPRLFRF